MQSYKTECICSYKLVNTRVVVNQTQPVLLSQPHKGKQTHSLCANSIVLLWCKQYIVEQCNNMWCSFSGEKCHVRIFMLTVANWNIKRISLIQHRGSKSGGEIWKSFFIISGIPGDDLKTGHWNNFSFRSYFYLGPYKRAQIAALWQAKIYL